MVTLEIVYFRSVVCRQTSSSQYITTFFTAFSIFLRYRPEDSIRLERMPDQLFDHAAALNHITEFYDEQKSSRNEELCKVEITREFHSEVQQETRPALEILLSLPKSVQKCFAALIQYLKDFKLEKILRITRYYSVHVHL